MPSPSPHRRASNGEGPSGVLLLHGFCGTPATLEPIADALVTSGFEVCVPLLPGHGTTPEDLQTHTYADWLGAASDALDRLFARVANVGVLGFSMGGALATQLTARSASVSALSLINPLVVPKDAGYIGLIEGLISSGQTMASSIGGDLADPSARDASYQSTPLVAALSLLSSLDEVVADLERVSAPVLLFSSRVDHVVEPANGDRVVLDVAGPVERVWLERSYHVAPLDFDRETVATTTVAFFDRELRGVHR